MHTFAFLWVIMTKCVIRKGYVILWMRTDKTFTLTDKMPFT